MKKQITKSRYKRQLIISICTDGCGGRPCFSITADLYVVNPNTGNKKWDMGGCLHKEILRDAPELKPFVALHSSDLSGVPIHAVENGFYWLCKAAGIPQKYEPEQDAETCFSYLLSHLRIEEREGNKIMGEVVNKYIDGKAKIATSEKVTAKCREQQEEQGRFDAKVCFSKIVDSMKPRWQNEASEALKQLEEMK